MVGAATARGIRQPCCFQATVIIGKKIVENWEDINQLELELPGYGNYKQQCSVECLGLTFENGEERRDYFIEKLRQKLKCPDFRWNLITCYINLE